MIVVGVVVKSALAVPRSAVVDWGTVTACAQAFFEVRHACSWVVSRKYLSSDRLNKMAGENRCDVHGACDGWDEWNKAIPPLSAGARADSPLAAVDPVLEKILKSSNLARTVDDLRLMIVRAMSTSFPGLAPITNVSELSADMSVKGEQRKVTLVTLLGQKNITEAQRSQLIARLGLSHGIIREEKRRLIRTCGVLGPGVIRHLNRSGRRGGRSRLVKKPAAAR